jgi:uncharacterized protein
MINEIIVTTTNADGSTHIVPMGVREESGLIVIAPFKPSATLENIQRNKTAVINRIDDVRIFAGCLTGRKDWPLVVADKIEEYRLEAALSHVELQLNRFEDDELRPRFYCQVIHEAVHKPFKGFSRAQAAVLEAAILVSRLHMLTDEKIEQEIEYLTIAIDKTAGENEKIAWGWLMDKIKEFREEALKDKTA